jgi:hypothetical protein
MLTAHTYKNGEPESESEWLKLAFKNDCGLCSKVF